MKRWSEVSRDPLGDRMKRYELPYEFALPRRTYTVVRVDGRAFHTFLRHADKPFDHEVTVAMRDTACRLANKLAGCVLAYTQSDEISLVLQDFATTETEPWFGGVVQKMASVAASTVTAIFTTEYDRSFERRGEDDYPTFDARVFTIADPVEVANYLLWRQRDCEKNSVGQLARCVLGHRTIVNMSSTQRREALAAVGQPWEELEPHLRRGWLIRKITVNEGELVRSRWEAFSAPEFDARPDGILAKLLPQLPRLREEATSG